MIDIPGPAWCLCKCCTTCEHELEGTLICGVDKQVHGAQDYCDNWKRCEYLIEMCGGCEGCEALAWWGREAEYWRRLAELRS